MTVRDLWCAIGTGLLTAPERPTEGLQVSRRVFSRGCGGLAGGLSLPRIVRIICADDKWTARPARGVLSIPFRQTIFLLLCAVLVAQGCDSGEKTEVLVAAAADALRQGKFAEAERQAVKALSYDAELGSALRIAGDAAARLEAFDRALKYYAQIPQNDVLNRAKGCCGAARVLVLGKFQLSQAEEQFRQALSVQPANYEALDGLSWLLSITGRRWESGPFFLDLVRSGHYDTGHLLGLGVLEYKLNERPRLIVCRRQSPNDPLPPLGLAQLAMGENDSAGAKSLLQTAVKLAPGLLEAQARLGQILLDNAEFEALEKWHAALPGNADEHPEIWVVRARWAQHNQERRAAVRCYLEALRLDPNHQLAASQIAVVLFSLGDEQLAKPFARRSQQLLRYHEVIQKLRGQPANPEFIAQAAQRAEAQSRLWEARGWYEQLLATGWDLDRTRKRVTELTSTLTLTTPQMLPSNNPARELDLASWPLPRWINPSPIDQPQLGPPPLDAPVRFEDLAQAVGLDFRYFNGKDPGKVGTRMYEVDGGGVGVLDYDGDGWPDIYLTQGCAWPPDPNQTEYYDRLFRNLGNGQFQDVTFQAGLRENGFGQGLAVGDFDNDGFPDLYIGNLGKNRLYHNCGDGTFEDVTERAGLTGNVWTSSCVIADLNGDTYPDIYEVNYLKDELMFDRVCPDRLGIPRICVPLMFDAEQDRLYVSLGDGTFRECGAEAGIHAGDGKGLGIVAADFDDSGKLSLFVANDVVENFFFYNETPAPGGPLAFSEQALIRGLAFADDGQAQACMGVAADDVNYDGLLDIFVANFYLEPNCLYLQQADHSFVDISRAANLRDPSFKMLGFGTQFIDGELDGLPDLVVTNGHLTDETDLGVPYRMRPQYFRNQGGARFVELPGNVVGDFFDEERLGRGLARLDWNRDGREDFAITFLDRPAALVTNQTQGVGHFLAVQLRGTRSARDAIGAKVTVEFGGFTRRRQLIGGDGYQVTCQRQLTFGLGPISRIDRLEVVWPSGERQSWNDVDVDGELRVIEGYDALQRIVK